MVRDTILPLLLFFIVSSSVLCLCSAATTTTVYIANTAGTSNGDDDGILVCDMDEDTGALSVRQKVKTAVVWYIEPHPNGKYVYTSGYNNAYYAYKVDTNGSLTEINSQPAIGVDPCYVSVDPSGRYLFGANYDSGSFVVFPIDAVTGALRSPSDVSTPGTGSQVQERQTGPHAHMIAPSRDGSHVLGVDLGSDKVFVYKFDANTGKLKAALAPYGQTISGAGPRHFSFHPTLSVVYVINELDCTVGVYVWNASSGAMRGLQVLSTLPINYNNTDGHNTGSEIRVHPSGQFVYCTNRGHHSVVVYKVDLTMGTLTHVEWVQTRGDTPRGMNISPSGRWLYTANVNGNNVTWFSIDQDKGTLKYKDQMTASGPVDVEFSVSK